MAWQERRDDQPSTTNLNHMPVKFDAVATALLLHVDGGNDRATLTARLIDLVKTGALEIDALRSLAGGTVAGADPLANAAARVDLVLQQFEQAAVLDPKA